MATPQATSSLKIPTTPDAPERGVLDGIRQLMAESGLSAPAVTLVIHGTTLATNALIERKGAKTALLVTEGFRDVVEMAFENRFEQYDIQMDRPPPLVPRHLRLRQPRPVALSVFDPPDAQRTTPEWRPSPSARWILRPIGRALRRWTQA